jgi:hypothetical protein
MSFLAHKLAELACGVLPVAALTMLLLPGCAYNAPRWGDQVTVTEIVFLSQRGVPPERIVAKMQRGGTVYYLTDEQYDRIRGQGVTPMVISAMRTTYTQALAEHPRLATDEQFECFTLGFDGVWYAGGPWGFHPDC